MSLRYSISVLALASALVASSPTLAQLGLSLGGDDGLNVGVDVNTDDGLGVDADVGLGGDDGVNVDADVGVGEDDKLVGADVDADVGGEDDDDETALDTDISIGVGSDDSLVDLDADARVLDDGADAPLVDLDAGATVGGEEQLIDADVDVNIGGGVVNGVSLLGLRGVEQSDALISLVGETKLAEVDLDATIDDQRVIIVNIDDTFSDETIAELDVALAGGNTGGIGETQAVVSASVVLSSVLANYGLSADDVLALQISEQGQTFVYVRADFENNLNVIADADIASENIADADVRLLDDGTIADADIDILPRAGDEIGEPLVDVDANISTPSEGDDQSSGLGVRASVDAAGEDAADADVNVLDGDAVAEASLDVLPDTDTQDNGVNADAGVDLGDTDVADLALAVLDDTLLSGDLVVLPGGDGAGSDDGASGGDEGVGGGDDGAAGGDDGAAGGDDGAGSGDDEGAGDDANGGVGGTPGGDAPDTITDTLMGQPGSMECPAGIRPFLGATANADALMAAAEAEVVVLTGCPTDGLFQTADFSRLRTVIERLPVTKAALDAASVPFEDVVSATVSGNTATIYVIE